MQENEIEWFGMNKRWLMWFWREERKELRGVSSREEGVGRSDL